MGIFNTVGSAVQNGIQQATNDAVDKLVNRTIPLEYNNLLDQGTDVFKQNATNEFLQELGIDANSRGYGNTVQQQLLDGVVVDAGNLVDAVLDEDLTPENYTNFTSFYTNEAMASVNNTVGKVAAAVNGVSNSQAALLVADTPKPLFAAAELKGFYLKKLYGSSGQAAEETAESKLRRLQMSHATGHATRSGSNQTGVTDSSGSLGTLTSYTAYTDILTQYAPKFKYTYIVEFNLHYEYTYKSDVPTQFTFLINRFTKPKISIEHEIVPFYNFRTSVPKLTTFEPISLTMHDDIKSEAMSFIISYLRRVSPIMNQPNPGPYNFWFEGNGMSFDDSFASYNLSTEVDNINIIDNITVYHLYNANRTMDVHKFINPKIESAEFGTFDMSDPDGCEITLNIVYDSYYPQFGVIPDVPAPELNITQLTASTIVEDIKVNGAKDLSNLTNSSSGTYSYQTDVTYVDPLNSYEGYPTVQEQQKQTGLDGSDTNLDGVGDDTVVRDTVVSDYNTEQNQPLERTNADTPDVQVSFDKIASDYVDTNPAQLTDIEATTLSQGLIDNNIDTSSALGETAVRVIANSITPNDETIANKLSVAYFPPDPNEVAMVDQMLGKTFVPPAQDQVDMVNQMIADYKASSGIDMLDFNGSF
jgi:hypothetical protein